MIDGIINETKNSRKIFADLPATYEELVALALEAGIPADIIISEEGWQQLPTWLNKANLLSDNTEEAVFGSAANRTVDAALKMLADVAYGRIATLILTVQDTDGNPIPEVTVKLDGTPVAGEGNRTDENGNVTISTNGGSHEVNLLYPLGYSLETQTVTMEVSGSRAETVQTVSRSFGSYQMISTAKTFYIARYLSPMQFHVHGGGGSGAANMKTTDNATISYGNAIRAQGGAGGYYTITDAIDVAGKLIRVTPGAGGSGVTITTPSTDNTSASANGRSGGASTVVVGDDSFTAYGGRGGLANTTARNEYGGASGGAGYLYPLQSNEDGADGPYLFDDSTLTQLGGGGGGSFSYHDDDDEGDPSHDYPTTRIGTEGAGGGTRGSGATNTNTTKSSTDAVTSGGSGAFTAINRTKYSGTKFGSGKGGDGFVAFRKAV